jgi:hypothetical protein
MTATMRTHTGPQEHAFGLPTRSMPMPVVEAVSLGDAFCFLVPVLQFLRFDLVGEMCVSDFLILAALPIAVLRHPERLRQKPVPTILTLGLFWLIAQIVTDLVRNSAPVDYLRGWSKICLLLANFTLVWLVACRSRRRFVLYGTGLGIGVILAFYAYPSGDALVSPWKFALGGPVTLLVVMGLSLAVRNSYLGIILPLTAMAVLHAFEDARNLAVITFVTAVFSVFNMSTAAGKQRLGRSRLAFLVLAIACGVWGFAQVYSHYAEQGVFGEYAQRKLEAQTSGAGGLLLGGRGEILASSQAILDSPLLGHGSWARDPIYAAILTQKRAELGYKEVDVNGRRRDDLIPTHSYLFGAWVEAGLAGALFWLFFLGFTIHTLVKVSGSEPLLPLFAFAGFLLGWDILFSPLGMPTRFISPYFMVAMVTLSTLRISHGEI